MSTEDDSTAGQDQDTTVGSWGEEAVRLLGAFADGLEDHLATGAQECTWCPVCRTVHAVRTVSPEVRTHLTAAAVSLAKAASALLAATAPDNNGSARRAEPDERVQRIRLDDDPDPA